MSVRVKMPNNECSEWSEPFPIDVVGTSGTTTSKYRSDRNGNKFFEIGVDIKLSATGLTKIIQLTPFYLLINNTDVSYSSTLKK